jgi:hypothetical protein
MSLTTVKERLALIIQGATPSTKVRGLPSTFKRIAIPEGQDPLDGRRFYFRLDAVSVMGPHIDVDGGFTRTVDNLVITVCYPEDLGGDEVDDHIHADYRVIMRALLDQTNWSPVASGIVNVSAAADTGRLVTSTVEREPGIIRLSIPLLVEHMAIVPTLYNSGLSYGSSTLYSGA